MVGPKHSECTDAGTSCSTSFGTTAAPCTDAPCTARSTSFSTRLCAAFPATARCWFLLWFYPPRLLGELGRHFSSLASVLNRHSLLGGGGGGGRNMHTRPSMHEARVSMWGLGGFDRADTERTLMRSFPFPPPPFSFPNPPSPVNRPRGWVGQKFHQGLEPVLVGIARWWGAKISHWLPGNCLQRR